MSGKKCLDCEHAFPITEFTKDKYRPDGLSPYCRSCKKERRKLSRPDIEKRKAAQKRWLANNPDYMREWQYKRYHAKFKDNSEYQAKNRENGRRYYQAKSQEERRAMRRRQIEADPDYYKKKRVYHLRKTYGVTVEQYNQMLEEQSGVCAICGKTQVEVGSHRGKHLSVDHDHTTGKVRGLLCHRCNLLIGYAEKIGDIMVIAKNALQYLERHA